MGLGETAGNGNAGANGEIRADGGNGGGDRAPGTDSPRDDHVIGEHAVSDIERQLCAGAAEGLLDRLQVRHPDAWRLHLPGLDSLLGPESPGPEDRARLRICIATEQITGPVRNGGIGSTYANLSLMLAEQGFSVTVLYLRGQQVETATIEHWVAHYAARGVRLVPAPDYARAERFASNADRWLRVPYNMMRWLIDNPMDVVHVSEWRGTGYLSLLAKRQGWAFEKTLFVVKMSSPWMWNRLYGGHMLDRADDLVKTHAERRSVELGDVVVGGSLHLLRWMASQGYALPAGRAFVQPNVATFASLEPLMRSRTLTPGTRKPIDELVFFGRLEVRKGLFVFCQAIRRLVRKGVPLPPRITFMGKPGGRLPSHPEMETPDYIREVSENWPCEVQILTGFQQYDAIEYLLGGQRLAVMPSIIENSSMAIYEAAICAIPTLATDVGGNAELIDARDHDAVLCRPHPVALADKLEEALHLGGMVPRPSFSNDANLGIWQAFHGQLAGALHRRLLDRAEDGRAADVAATAGVSPSSAVCIYFTGHAGALDATLASLAAQTVPPADVLIGVDADNEDDCTIAAEALERHGFPARAIECFDLDAGAAFNRLADAAAASHALFVWEGATLEPHGLAQLQAIAARTGADVLSYLAEVRELGAEGAPELKGQFIVGVADAFFDEDGAEMPLFVRRDAFARVGGFTTDYRLLGYDREFVARAQLAGMVCETVPARLGSTVAQPAEWLRARGYDLSATMFRIARPKLAAAPLAMRDTLLLARGMAARGGGKGKADPAANPEGVLMRILAGLKPDRAAPASAPDSVPDGAPESSPDGAPDRAKRSGKAAPRRTARNTATDHDDRGAGVGSFLALLDKMANEDGFAPIDPPRPARPRGLSGALKALAAAGDLGRDGQVVGQVLGIHGNRIHGWAAHLGKGAAPVSVELIVDGVTQVTIADRNFAPFAQLPAEAMRAGFVIELPPQVDRRKSGTAWRVAVVGSACVLGEGVAMPRGTVAAGLGLDGALDHGTEMIMGTVRHRREPMRRCVLALFADGVFVARIAGDVADQGRFALTLPDLLQAGGARELAVVDAETGVLLPGGPLALSDGRVVRARSGFLGVFGR